MVLARSEENTRCRSAQELAHFPLQRQTACHQSHMQERGTAMQDTKGAPATWTRRGIRSTPLLLVAGLLVWLAQPFALTSAQDSDLVGEYAVSIVKEDVPLDMLNGPTTIGQWRVAFESDGSYSMSRSDLGEMVTGTYEVDGNQVTITDEDGLMSCASLAADPGETGETATSVYTWAIDGDLLSLTPEEESCDTRELILTTRELDHFVSCETQPISSELAATPEQATPVEATPEETGLGALVGQVQEASPSPADVTSVEQGIDGLLEQLTACWATGDPSRFLPLLTDEYAATLLSAGDTQDDLIRSLATAMGTAVTYERAGDVNLIDDMHASAIVRTSNGQEEQFTRFRFALVDGEWKLDGPA
jgi:hypothetical protein